MGAPIPEPPNPWGDVSQFGNYMPPQQEKEEQWAQFMNQPSPAPPVVPPPAGPPPGPNPLAPQNTAGGGNPQPPLAINLGPGIQRALASLGGNAEQRLRNILTSIQTKPIIRRMIGDTGRLNLGLPELTQILRTISNPRRQQFFGSIIDFLNNEGDGSGPGPHDGSGPGPHGGGGIPPPQFDLGNGLIDITDLPNYDLIQQTIAQWLSGENPLTPLEIDDPLGGLRGLTESSIRDLLKAEGLPQDVIDAAENTISARVKAAKGDSMRRSSDIAASRGILNSGLAERSARDIEMGFGETLASQLSDLGLMNAQQAAGQRQLGLQGANLLGNMGLATQSLGIQGALGERGQDLQALSTSLGGMLGLGNLGLENAQSDLQRQFEEFRMGLLANALSQSGGGEGGGLSGIPDWLGDWLNGGGFNNPPGYNPEYEPR